MNYQPNYMPNGYYGINGMYGMGNINNGNNNIQQQIPKYQQEIPQYSQPQSVYKPALSLQGKTVDSIDVVKATDIPLDGSITYFPLTDGSAIVTKQLMQDGTSKVIVFKPIDENEGKNIPKYVTSEELDEKIKALSNNEFKDDLKNIKRQIKGLQEDLEDINKDLKKRKD